MIVSYSVCSRDEAIAVSTLEWAITLDGRLPYDAILSVGDGVDAEPIHRAMEKLFRSVTEINSYAPNTWPQGKNLSFQNLVRYLDTKRSAESFFWWEPDAIPLKKGWLAEIEREHIAGGKAFTGFVHDALKSMECVGVYPPNFMEFSPTNGMLCRAAPWDRCAAQEIVGHVHRINHLMQFVHDVDGLVPTFENGDLSLIRKDAVLFHKNKNGSLVEQLSKGKIKRWVRKFFTAEAQRRREVEPIVVVFAPCARDIDQAIHHAKWLRKLGRRYPHQAIVATDPECPNDKASALVAVLLECFQGISRFVYPTPTNKSYPAVANFAFARVAEMMASQSAPWFWFESDTVVLKADWLEVLQKEYEAGGKPFMGPVVKETGFGHANGSCVYPPDTVQRIPKALRQTSVAWDYAMRDEVNGDCHDASGIIQHIWGLVDGPSGRAPSQTNGKRPPEKFTRELARKILLPSAVLVHRVKDTSLVEILMSGGFR
jgi:hypothetical protein